MFYILGKKVDSGVLFSNPNLFFRFPALFNAADKDRNGKLTKEESENHLLNWN